MVNTVRDCYFILFDTKYFILIGTSERQECKGRGGGEGGGEIFVEMQQHLYRYSVRNRLCGTAISASDLSISTVDLNYSTATIYIYLGTRKQNPDTYPPLYINNYLRTCG